MHICVACIFVKCISWLTVSFLCSSLSLKYRNMLVPHSDLTYMNTPKSKERLSNSASGARECTIISGVKITAINYFCRGRERFPSGWSDLNLILSGVHAIRCSQEVFVWLLEGGFLFTQKQRHHSIQKHPCGHIQ